MYDDDMPMFHEAPAHPVERRAFTLSPKKEDGPVGHIFAEPFGADSSLRTAFEKVVEEETDASYKLATLRDQANPTRYLFASTQQAFEFFKAGYAAGAAKTDPS